MSDKMTTTKSTKRRKNINKNKKRNWKFTDINDVEEFIEDKRLDERIGGPVDEKTDEDLFFVDTAVVEESPLPAKKAKRELKPLRCHAILELDSKIPPIKTSKNRIKEAHNERRKSARVLNNKKYDGLSRKQQEAEKNRTISKEKREQRIKTRFNTHPSAKDIWGESSDIEVKEQGSIDEFHNKYTKKTLPKPPSHYRQKPSGVGAVVPALPGQSYNPSYEDHQALILKAAIVEQAKVDETERISRALDKKFPDKSEAPTERSYIEEMSIGLFDDGEPRQEFTSEELDKLSVNPPVRREKKKTEKQRRKEKERKEEEKKRLLAKKEKIKLEQYTRIKSIKKSVNKLERDLVEKAEQKASLKEENKDKPKRLGRVKYEEPDLDLKLSEELEGSLRRMAPEGHLLHDRFMSLQKRNIVEPRNFHAKKKKRNGPKKYDYVEKKGHREITE